MHTTQKRRLQWVLSSLLVLGIVAGLVLYALQQNISLYVTPSELLARPAAATQSFRLGGYVRPGSVQHAAQGVLTRFVVTDFQQDIRVEHRGVLPTLFREGQGVVMDGKVRAADSVFVATRVLAKHDENYKPPGLPGVQKGGVAYGS